jgi:hypothetical protein
MRIPIAVLLVGLAGAAWWGLREAAPPSAATTVSTAPQFVAPAAPPPAPPSSGAIAFSPRPVEAPSPGNIPLARSVAPPTFSVVGAVLLPGQKPALTLRVAGELRTVMEGDMIDGHRVERIEPDRVVLLHLESGSRVERLYADLGPTNSAPIVASASGGAATAVPSPGAATAATALYTPPVPTYVAPVPPPGATVNDNPLVGAIIPTAPGQAPPGMSGPRPVPLRPGQAPPPGPVPMPVPPNAQGPVTR